jgi:hypothetical protein
MERFFSLSHLTLEQLRNLYLDASRVGKPTVEYDKTRSIEESYEFSLPEDMILENIAAGDDNHLVFREDYDDFPDATTVVLPLPNHPRRTPLGYVKYRSRLRPVSCVCPDRILRYFAVVAGNVYLWLTGNG